MSEQGEAPSLKDVLLGVADAFAGATTVACVIAGHRSGFYSAMRDGSQMTADELAGRVGTNPRMTREWLDQQAAASIVTYDEEVIHTLSHQQLQQFWQIPIRRSGLPGAW